MGLVCALIIEEAIEPKLVQQLVMLTAKRPKSPASQACLHLGHVPCDWPCLAHMLLCTWVMRHQWAMPCTHATYAPGATLLALASHAHWQLGLFLPLHFTSIMHHRLYTPMTSSCPKPRSVSRHRTLLLCFPMYRGLQKVTRGYSFLPLDHGYDATGTTPVVLREPLGPVTCPD